MLSGPVGSKLEMVSARSETHKPGREMRAKRVSFADLHVSAASLHRYELLFLLPSLAVGIAKLV
jgi:hypothetical protein